MRSLRSELIPFLVLSREVLAVDISGRRDEPGVEGHLSGVEAAVRLNTTSGSDGPRNRGLMTLSAPGPFNLR